jgi:hypothetical protein
MTPTAVHRGGGSPPPGHLELTRDVTVNGESFGARAFVSEELLRFQALAVGALIQSDLDAAVRAECRRRWGAGSLIRLAPDRYRWEALATAQLASPYPPAAGPALSSSH